MIDPKSLDLSALPSLPLEQKTDLPASPAIYFAIDSLNRIQYIGQTLNLNRRWVQHHRHSDLTEIGGICVAYLFVDAVEMLPEIEKALIQWFNPALNSLYKVKPADATAERHYARRFTFTIEPDLYEPLKIQARKERRSVGSLLNWLAAQYLEDQQGIEIESTIQHGGNRRGRS